MFEMILESLKFGFIGAFGATTAIFFYRLAGGS